MTITTVDEFDSGFHHRYQILKTSVSSLSGIQVSFWRVAGTPAAGGIPATTAVVCNNLTTGAMIIPNPTGSRRNYIQELNYACTGTQSHVTLEIHDRLVHAAGLSGTVVTLQSVFNMDLSTLLATDNMADRIGDANYSDVQWWIEWYTATGGTSTNANVSVVYNDGTTGTLVVAFPGSAGAARMLPLNALIPAIDSGKYIRGLTGITLVGTTGTAGSFGFTATRYRGGIRAPVSNKLCKADWFEMGFPEIIPSSCLFPVVNSTSTTTGNVTALVKVVTN